MNAPTQTMREHLLSRSLNPSLYRVLVDEEAHRATFLLYSLTGCLAGYQTYNPTAPKNTADGRKQGFKPEDLKYFTHSRKDVAAVFGLEMFEWQRDTLYVVEGVFDAVKLHLLGLNAVAVLGNDPKQLRGFLAAFPHRKVGVLDNDPGGRELGKSCDEFFLCPPGRDPGDMTTDELKELLRL